MRLQQGTHVDPTVLTGAAEGDQDCWRQLVGCYSPRLYGLVWRRCGDRGIAEEVVQETFMKAVGRLGMFSDVGGFEAWLFRVARNAMLDRLRKRKRWGRVMTGVGVSAEGRAMVEDVAGNDPGPAEQAQKAELIERLRGWVDQLGPKDREVLHLRHTAQLKYEQIAEVLGEPVGTVLSRGHRAVKKLQQKLIEAGFLEEAGNALGFKKEGADT